MQELLFSFVFALHQDRDVYKAQRYFTFYILYILMKKSLYWLVLLLIGAALLRSLSKDKAPWSQNIDTGEEINEDENTNNVDAADQENQEDPENVIDAEDTANEEDEINNENEEDQNNGKVINLENSSVKWVGRSWPKSHNGTVAISSADLEFTDWAISWWKIVLDMTSMKATDIDSEGLDNHLKAEDFFDVANHPTATFTINWSVWDTVTWELTIKWKTLPIAVATTTLENWYSADLSIDGTQRWVNDSGVKDALVSDTIDLDVQLMY